MSIPIGLRWIRNESVSIGKGELKVTRTHPSYSCSTGTVARITTKQGYHYDFEIELSEETIAKLKEAVDNAPGDPTGYLLPPGLLDPGRD